ncbi:Exporter protein, RND family [hydrothermal vent metagenome]|uniref:Exporter protein, RND family n=1 Tax=hydrothermal vent metagenome TaxID=652676 RepID=A0A3B1D3U3_9ZZZZ
MKKLSFSKKICHLILNKPLIFIIGTLIITIAAGILLPQIKIDNSVEVFFNKQGKSYLHFQEWKDQFGSDELVIVAFSDKDIFTHQNLTLIDTLSEELEMIDGVDNVQSLTTVNNIIGQDQDFIVEPLIETIPTEPHLLQNIKKEALRNPLYVNNIISKDGRTAAFMIELENMSLKDDIYVKYTIENIQKKFKEIMPEKMPYHISGLTPIEHYFALYMQDDLKKFMPFMLMVIGTILYFCFRHIKLMMLPFLCILINLIMTMGLLQILGFSINNITTIIPPLLMAMAIADSVHFLTESIHQKNKLNTTDQITILGKTIDNIAVPCLLTTITTMVGFLSLSLSKIPPVHQLGITVAGGILIAFLITFTFLPALMKKYKLLNTKNKIREAQPDKPIYKTDIFLHHLGKYIEKNKNFILISTVVLIIFCLWGMTKIKVETSVLEFFHKNSPIYKSTLFIEDNLSGVHTLNISLKADKLDYFKAPQALKNIEKLHTFLATIKEVDDITSVVDYIKDINQSFHNENPDFYIIPESKNLVAQYLLLYGQTDLNDFVDSQWQWTTVRVRLKEHSTIKLKKIIAHIQTYLDDPANDLPQGEQLGQTVLEVETNNTVTEGQMQSLGLAVVAIFGMLFIVFRSFSVGLVSIIPNLLPLLINFGIMGWFGIRLDSATSMISAIGIGIVVDDTIHFIHSFKENLKETGDYTKAMHSSLQSKGRPIILTSIILFFGFGTVAFSSFVPTAYFGLLSSLIMINAVLADLIILPAFLIHFKPKFHG